MVERKSGMVLNRRTALKFFALAGGAGMLGLSLPALRGLGLEAVSCSRAMLGTVVNLTVYGRDRDRTQAALTATLDRMAGLEARLSRFRADSEVGSLNRTGLLPAAGEDLLAVLALARKVSEKSSGAFDITMLPLLRLYGPGEGGDTAPASGQLEMARKLVDYRGVLVERGRVSLARAGMGVTLDGIGKGYIVDAAVETLTRHGFYQVYVEAGGDLLFQGGKPGGEPWRIGIAPPRPGMKGELTVVSGIRQAVATSGDYQNYFSPDYSRHHIIDPRTALSPSQLASATVTAPTAALADALATAAMVLGLPGAMDLLAGFPGCRGRFVAKDLTVHQSAGFAA